MRRGDRDRLICSPSDLVTFLKSPYATWMDRRRVDDPNGAAPAEKDPEAELLARKGDEHEARVLERLRADGRKIVVIQRRGGADDPFAETLGAFESGADVVYQAALRHEDFEGFADFVVRAEGGGFEVWDAKLSRSVRPDHVLQLCCYADLLGQARGGLRVGKILIALGDGERSEFRTTDFHWYYAATRAGFLELLDAFDPARPIEPEPNRDHGEWAAHADAWFEERDHVVRVAGVRRSQIARLAEAGITTMAALGRTELPEVPGIGPGTFPRLAAQARLQLASVGRERPLHEVLRPRPDLPRSGLALLPPANAADVYFDMEGFPLADGGLEYLFGVVTLEGNEPRFRDWWAHDQAGERAAFEAFIDFVMERWRRDRGMHVYHYASYEVQALRRLMGKHGTREDDVDTLLRAEVFVDLYEVVRNGVMVGEPSYSLKNVEHLYRKKREGAIVDAAGSLVQYDRWLESGEAADWKQSPLLAAIRDYNRADCESTAELAAWLRARQGEAGIAFVEASPREGEPDRALSPENQARRDLSVAMREEAARVAPERRRVHELLGQLVEFHRLEEKPAWWDLFDKRGKTPAQLVEDPHTLGDLRLAGDPEPVGKGSWTVPYTFDPEQDTAAAEGETARIAHDVDVEVQIESLDLAEGRVQVRFRPKAWGGVGSRAPDRLSLVPFAFINPKVIQDAIMECATSWREGRPIPRALEDFLLRRGPRVAGHEGGPLLRPGESAADGMPRVASALDESCLVVQGPPGSGKTRGAACAIVALLKAGKNVGVTSNGHKAIENLLAACDREHGGGLPMLKSGGDEDSPVLSRCTALTRCGNSDGREEYAGGLVGGTAFLFARPEWRGALDYLFVDEAGQVSVANLVGMARSARNLVLIGDQMQLSQPTQGWHPGDSGLSLLDYYLGGRRTVPDDLGLFLGQTWRLHPAICDLVSDAVYEGRLAHEPRTERRVVRVPAGATLVRKEAGIVFVPVEHDGNDQWSEEEVAAIEQVVKELVGRELTDPAKPRRLTLEDILFVAPYNKQVRRLRARLGARAKVASVDKFQGQEAPVVVLSMCASAGEFGPRGSAFLLDLNRLNVAISRAQSLAVIVGDPRLGRARASSIDEMRRLNLLCRLVAAGA